MRQKSKMHARDGMGKQACERHLLLVSLAEIDGTQVIKIGKMIVVQEADTNMARW